MILDSFLIFLKFVSESDGQKFILNIFEGERYLNGTFAKETLLS